MLAQCFPVAVVFTAASEDHFSSLVLLLPWVMASAYCRLDRPGGAGLASE